MIHTGVQSRWSRRRARRKHRRRRPVPAGVLLLRRPCRCAPRPAGAVFAASQQFGGARRGGVDAVEVAPHEQPPVAAVFAQAVRKVGREVLQAIWRSAAKTCGVRAVREFDDVVGWRQREKLRIAASAYWRGFHWRARLRGPRRNWSSLDTSRGRSCWSGRLALAAAAQRSARAGRGAMPVRLLVGERRGPFAGAAGTVATRSAVAGTDSGSAVGFAAGGAAGAGVPAVRRRRRWRIRRALCRIGSHAGSPKPAGRLSRRGGRCRWCSWFDGGAAGMAPACAPPCGRVAASFRREGALLPCLAAATRQRVDLLQSQPQVGGRDASILFSWLERFRLYGISVPPPARPHRSASVTTASVRNTRSQSHAR